MAKLVAKKPENCFKCLGNVLVLVGNAEFVPGLEWFRLRSFVNLDYEFENPIRNTAKGFINAGRCLSTYKSMLFFIL